MKENKYDDGAFFAKYSRFHRSIAGLDGAGEWHELKKLLPDFAGKRVLDIGCGFGWHCAYAAEHGASYVLGTDISERMLAAARAKNSFTNVEYKRIAMEELDFLPGSFDAVISSLAFHYTPDFEDISRRISRFLAPGGDFVFSVEHPVFTAQGKQDWIYGDDGRPAHWPVDDYFREGRREAVFLGERVIKYHRTVDAYFNALIRNGFCVTGLVEPTPPAEWVAGDPAMSVELRRPMMLLFAARMGRTI